MTQREALPHPLTARFYLELGLALLGIAHFLPSGTARLRLSTQRNMLPVGERRCCVVCVAASRLAARSSLMHFGPLAATLDGVGRMGEGGCYLTTAAPPVALLPFLFRHHH